MRQRYSSRFGSQRRKRSFLPFLLLISILAGGAAWFLFFETESPQAFLNVTTRYLGKNSTIEIEVTDEKSGIKSVRLFAVQNSSKQILYQKVNPRTGYQSPVGPKKEKAKIAINSKKLGLSEGTLQLVLEVTDFSLQRWLQGNKTTITKELIIDTEAPKIQILHTGRHISPGESGMVIYRVTDPKATTGIEINGLFVPAYPVTPQSQNTYIAYFGLPHDIVSLRQLTITATDEAQKTTTVPFALNLRRKDKKRDSISISDEFLNRKIPEFKQYYPEMSGTLKEQYLYVNNTIRRKNADEILAVCQHNSPNQLWSGAFLRMPGSGKAGFAEYRSYLYKGRVIDHQVHLGMDIASVKRADVKAANTGQVVFADYLGIYGNMVILDHGQGIFSLYSHLSQINVPVGTKVQKGQIIGLTGTSGMAGGDHLHFSMLVHGIFVNPKEWWDKNWIETNIENPIKKSGVH